MLYPALMIFSIDLYMDRSGQWLTFYVERFVLKYLSCQNSLKNCLPLNGNIIYIIFVNVFLT